MNQWLNKFSLMLVLALSSWFLVFYQGIVTAANIWVISDIYNHCLLVLPFSLYCIYRKRHLLHYSDLKPSLLPLLPLSVILFVQVFATIGDINIFMHIATFSALPLIIWLCVGHRIARILAFPLFFILFAIPIGDELIPYLQELTTDIAVPLLQLSNVPIYRNGLYLDIPEGRFLVAEACSGISFLISSIVFGFLYAYISFSSIKKRIIFIAVSIIVPILANAIRVYGIVLTGHLTDMKHAVGADHLIYGGVFYTIVLFILIVIGEKFRDKNYSISDGQTSRSYLNGTKPGLFKLYIPISLLIGAMIIQQAWLYNISNINTPIFTIPKSALLSNVNREIRYQDEKIPDWNAKFNDSDIEVTGAITTPFISISPVNDNSAIINTFISYYSGTGAELISSAHRLFDTNKWAQVSSKNRIINQQPVTLSYIASAKGQHRYLLHWYEINGKHFNSTRNAKLYQAYLSLLGQQASGVKVILTTNSQELTEKAFVMFVNDNIDAIRYNLYTALQKNS